MAKRIVANDRSVLDTRLVLQVLSSVKKGDFTARLPANWTGLDGKIADTLNDIIEMMSDSTKENRACKPCRRQRRTVVAAVRASAG